MFTVLRIFRRKRLKIQVPTFLEGLSAEIFFLCLPAPAFRIPDIVRGV